MINFPSIPELLISLRKTNAFAANNSQIDKHISASIGWIIRAHEVTIDGGVSKGYSLLRGSWSPSYPETTGYTIPTLLNVSSIFDRADIKALAISLAQFLLRSTTAEGGVSHFVKTKQQAVVFDTGQAIFGWIGAFKTTGDDQYLFAARRAGDWLVSIQHPSGSWKDNQHLGVEKVIDTRVAWALLELYRTTEAAEYYNASLQNLEWALTQQEDDGWFRRCALVEGEDPLTHTLAYTIEGLYECGCILDNERYISLAKHSADALLANQRPNGSLSSTFRSGWHETSLSSCLTGIVQLARLWLRLYESTNEMTYCDAAKKAIAFVASTQNLETSNQNIRGAIAGSHPIYGRYERFKYPNWAAKFFIDALLALRNTNHGTRFHMLPG